jgi:pentatricopeptide repeat protein
MEKSDERKFPFSKQNGNRRKEQDSTNMKGGKQFNKGADINRNNNKFDKRAKKFENKLSQSSTPQTNATNNEEHVSIDEGIKGLIAKSNLQNKEEKRTVVVESNKQIAIHANRKELQKAKEIFNSLANEKIANIHSFAAIINTAIRCGQIDYAESLFKQLKKTFTNLPSKDVVIYTTLMKGYCNHNFLHKAFALFEEMVTTRPVLKPNIRTVNTLLRGCITNGNFQIADKVINIFQKQFQMTLDINSYEYLITLYSQVLNINKILPIIGRIKQDQEANSTTQSTLTEATSMETVDQLVPENEENGSNNNIDNSLISMNMNLLRALSLLGELKLVRKTIQSVQSLLGRYEEFLVKNGDSTLVAADGTTTGEKKKFVTGGKKAWKESHQPEGSGATASNAMLDRRSESLVIYRRHQVEEWKYDLSIIENFINQQFPFESSSTNNTKGDLGLTTLRKQSFDMLFPYFFRLVAFDEERVTSDFLSNDKESEGSTSSRDNKSYFSRHILEGLYHKFGLNNLFQTFFQYSVEDILSAIINQKDSASSMISSSQIDLQSFLSFSSIQQQSIGNSKGAKKTNSSVKSKIDLNQPQVQQILKLVEELLKAIIAYFAKKESPSQEGKAFIDFNDTYHLSQLARRRDQSASSSSTAAKKPHVKLEICSGTGDWAIAQVSVI